MQFKSYIPVLSSPGWMGNLYSHPHTHPQIPALACSLSPSPLFLPLVRLILRLLISYTSFFLSRLLIVFCPSIVMVLVTTALSLMVAVLVIVSYKIQQVSLLEQNLHYVSHYGCLE